MPLATAERSGIELNLKLTVEEARTLRAMVQNPLGPDESQTESEIRRAIFDALAQADLT